MTPDERKVQQEMQRKLRLAQRYQLKVLCGVCLHPCILEGYDAKGEGGRWQCGKHREHWD